MPWILTYSDHESQGSTVDDETEAADHEEGEDASDHPVTPSERR